LNESKVVGGKPVVARCNSTTLRDPVEDGSTAEYSVVNARLCWLGIAMTTHQTNFVTFVLIVRIPAEGIEDFQAYEDAVLPLLPEFNGRLERRLRNQDGTVEMHIVSFASDADFQNYRNNPRRAAQVWLLEKSSAKVELLSMANVS
jgi:hypothetical protein